MKKVILLTLFLFTALPVFPADWITIVPKLYLDKETVTYSNDYFGNQIVSFWIKELNNKGKHFKAFENILKTKVWYIIDQYNINCTNKTIRTTNSVIYDLSDYPIYHNDTPNNWQGIVPSTRGDSYYKIFCREH